jgi:PAS domain S-box-containing protein
MSQDNTFNQLQKRVTELEKENFELSDKLNRIKEIYNNTTIGLYRTNPEGDILMANPPLVKMLGFQSFEEMRLHNLNNDQLITKEERREFLKKIDKEGVIIGRQAIWLKKDGKQFYIRESSKAIRNEKGKIIFYEGTVEDITAQKTKEKKLQESEFKYKRLVEILPNGVVIHKDNIIIFANEYAKNTVRAASRESLIGKDVFNYIHPEYHKLVKTRIKKSLINFSQANFTEQLFLTESGTHIPVEVTTTPYISENEVYLLTVFSDISDRKQTEKELKLSEVTYRGMINSISESIFIQNLDGSFIDANNAAEKLFGYNNEFFQQKTPRDIAAKDKNDLGEIFSRIESAYKGEREIIEFWGQKQDGTIFPTEMSLATGTYYDKRVVIAVLRDITERKITETIINESEKKYRQLINFAVGGILIGSNDGYIIEANSYMYKLLGRKRKDIIGKRITDDLFSKESLQTSPLNFEQLRNGKSIINVREIIRPDGTKIPIEMHSKMMPDGTFQSIYHDISTRKKAEKEIIVAKTNAEALNLHKDALLSALPDMLFTFNSEGIVIDFYSNSNEHLISSPKIFLNKSVHEFIPKDIANETLVHIKKVLSTKKMLKFQYSLEVNNIIEHFDAKMVYFKEDTVLTIIRNITERMDMIKDLEDSRKKAEESDKLKSAFLSNLSHEIRTPMNGILGFTELLKDDISKSEKLEYIDIIESSSNQLLLILDDIIEISKIEAGIMTKKIESFEINSFLKNIHSQMNGLFSKNRNVKLILSNKLPSDNINSISDPIKLKQILSNFISNAYKFTETGHVELGYKQISDTFIQFYVKDTGIGISKDNIDKIFNRFVQIENKLSDISRGSGLGLSICLAYAEILNGEINVESKIGTGSTFYLKIPIISFS